MRIKNSEAMELILKAAILKAIGNNNNNNNNINTFTLSLSLPPSSSLLLQDKFNELSENTNNIPRTSSGVQSVIDASKAAATEVSLYNTAISLHTSCMKVFNKESLMAHEEDIYKPYIGYYEVPVRIMQLLLYCVVIYSLNYTKLSLK